MDGARIGSASQSRAEPRWAAFAPATALVYERGLMAGSHDYHAADEHVQAQPHPAIPTITDEAADTPMWVPIAGLSLFLLLALFVALRSAMAPEEPAPEATTDEAVEAAAEAPAAE